MIPDQMKLRVGSKLSTSWHRRRSPLCQLPRANYERHIERLEKHLDAARAQLDNRDRAMETLREIGARVASLCSEAEQLRRSYRQQRLTLAPALSPAEHRVLEATVSHPELGVKGVAAELGVTERVVKFHQSSIYKKLGVRGRNEL